MKKIIQLEEFPDTIYLSLSDSDHKKLWKNLLKNISIKQVAEEFKIPVRNLYKYKEGDSGYPLAILKKLLKKTKIKINQANIKTQRNSNSMKIKIPIRITEKFTEFLGYLFGDGGIDHQFGVHFTTNDKKSLNQFDNLVKEVFGDIEKQEYDYGTRITYYYPKILGVLLSEIFKIPKGNKVDSDIEIPDDISSIPKYLCEYRDGSFRKSHQLTSQFIDKHFSQSINVSGNVTADYFFGNGSFMNVNSSDYWDTNDGSLDDINTDQFNNNAGTLELVLSGLQTLLDSVY
ncbi:MAG: hypothetical protein GW914_02925, partial [Candidatus Aenigmarchaeota archaeon]|nr:hypothetical protein [Candidatus Aenigmarchaeota archaeon]